MAHVLFEHIQVHFKVYLDCVPFWFSYCVRENYHKYFFQDLNSLMEWCALDIFGVLTIPIKCIVEWCALWYSWCANGYKVYLNIKVHFKVYLDCVPFGSLILLVRIITNICFKISIYLWHGVPFNILGVLTSPIKCIVEWCAL
jgi:hypothetical protein